MEAIPFEAVLMNLGVGEFQYFPIVPSVSKRFFVGDQQDEEFLKINPLGKVPVIIDDGFILTESVAILKYLSDKYASTDRWFPKDLSRRARVDEYCAWQHGNTRMKSVGVFWREVLLRRPPHKIEPAIKEMNKMLDDLADMFLKNNKFIAGDECTAADILAVCEIMQLTVSGRDPLVDRPALKAWMERVRSYTSPYFDEAHYALYEWSKRFASQSL